MREVLWLRSGSLTQPDRATWHGYPLQMRTFRSGAFNRFRPGSWASPGMLPNTLRIVRLGRGSDAGCNRSAPPFTVVMAAIRQPTDDELRLVKNPTDLSIVADNIIHVADFVVEKYEFTHGARLPNTLRDNALTRVKRYLWEFMDTHRLLRRRFVKELFALADQAVDPYKRRQQVEPPAEAPAATTPHTPNLRPAERASVWAENVQQICTNAVARYEEAKGGLSPAQREAAMAAAAQALKVRLAALEMSRAKVLPTMFRAAEDALVRVIGS